MKTIAFGGFRLFMKFEGLEYFRAPAKDEGLQIIEARADAEEQFADQVKAPHGLGGHRSSPKAQAFGIRVCAYDPYLDDDIFEMMGESDLKLMKPSAVIVNTAHGAIAGAATDVLVSEAPDREQS